MNTLIDFGVIVAIVIGAVQVVKIAGLNKKLLPVVSIVFGVSLSFMWGYGFVPVNELILQGLIAGLSASGLFSGGKTIVSK